MSWITSSPIIGSRAKGEIRICDVQAAERVQVSAELLSLGNATHLRARVAHPGRQSGRPRSFSNVRRLVPIAKSWSAIRCDSTSPPDYALPAPKACAAASGTRPIPVEVGRRSPPTKKELDRSAGRAS